MYDDLRDMNVGIIFRRNASGDRYIFYSPVILSPSKSFRGQKYFSVSYGAFQDRSFSSDQVLTFDSKKVLSTLQSKKDTLGLDGKIGDKKDLIVLLLNDELREYVYNELRKGGKEPSPSDFLVSLSGFAYNVGNSIDYIMPGKLRSFTCFTKETSEVKNFSHKVSEDEYQFLNNNVFSNKRQKKTEEAKAVASQSSNVRYTTPPSTISKKSATPARKITVEKKKKEKEEEKGRSSIGKRFNNREN